MKLYSTLSRQKEPLNTTNGKIKMYVCGVTPYAPSHVGHAMSYIIFDVLKRYLEFKDIKVIHIQNFTDIEDKLIKESTNLGISVKQLSEKHIADYFEVMDSLNIKRANTYPKASEEIPTIIEIIINLINKDMAYPSGDDVYFRVRKQTDYGKLSHRSIDDMKAGARVAISEGKEDPMDFALWKGAKPGEPSWESPWGKGRPGWHIECSAMSYKYLGETIDIHGGGQDLVFPHHENEIAQTEAFTQTIPFSRIWVHNGLLQFAKEKMSKSLGNIISIADALTKVSSDALRLFFLSSHYRNPLLYSDELVLAQEKALDRLRNAMKVHNTNANNHQKEVDPSSYRENFISAMEDDLNTPQALASLFNLAREINRGIKNGSSITLAQSNLSELLNVLGLTLSEQPINESEDKSSMINLLIELRNDLRDAQLYELADKVRKGLASSGISLEDTSDGTKWKIDRK